MPVKARTAKTLRPSFSAEVLELFVELEHAPRRRTEEFQAKEKRLASLLNLVPHWWATCSVLDKSPCCWTPSYAAYGYWHECRLVREQLLAATGSASVPSSRQTAVQ